MKLFLGIDGGQSATTALIGDETGRILGEGEAGPCNHASAAEGRAKLERAVAGSVGEAFARTGLDVLYLQFEVACLGMSGGPDDKEAILAAWLPAKRLIVTTDAAIALAGATADGVGIVVIAGTGSIAFGRRGQRTARAGGWGHIFGDEGGAFDLVRQALRAALAMEEGWGPATRLREALLETTGAPSANDLLHRFYSDAGPRARVARLAELVDRMAAEGDAVAAVLIRGAAQELATLAGSVRSQLWEAGDPVEVAYVGGVFSSGMLRERIRTLIELNADNRCVAPRHSPAEGALLEAYRAAGKEVVLRR